MTLEASGQRRLLAGEDAAAAPLLRAAADAYRASWEQAPPASYGRLIGMLKAAVLAGGGEDEAAYARRELPGEPDGPPAAYALAIAALVQDDDATASAAAAQMRGASEAFARAADAITALTDGDRPAYGQAVEAIVADFEHRDDHLTGVPIADTAVMLECFARRRGMAAEPSSAVMPRAAR